MDNLHHIHIPTPFDLGRVHCYLFDGEGVTLLDPGPGTDEALAACRDGLRERGYSISDVDRILLTHPHTDHFGLARQIVERSGARMIAHSDATRVLVDPRTYDEQRQRFFRPFFESMGVPVQIVETAISHLTDSLEYKQPVMVDQELTDGDRIDIGVELTAIHTPGHDPGSICFVSLSDKVAFTGDHVLDHMTPNPLLTISPDTENERTRSLPSYLKSLHRIQNFDIDVAHAGHGDSIQDLDARVQKILDHHHDRKERIAGLVEQRGPITAYELMQELFPGISTRQILTGMSEVIGHLDLLEDERRVEIDAEAGIHRYALV
jgi:glyoxylase-like metal-dependent hydrolase (beta-lactamase superfamily II)